MCTLALFLNSARMGNIFLTVGDLFACGKAASLTSRPKWRHKTETGTALRVEFGCNVSLFLSSENAPCGSKPHGAYEINALSSCRI
ncbi:MAG: hypothetical protein Q4G63_06645 [Bacteroidia bacterium]|nr:hypothetical protein [Bacteroidia bacterium]